MDQLKGAENAEDEQEREEQAVEPEPELEPRGEYTEDPASGAVGSRGFEEAATATVETAAAVIMQVPRSVPQQHANATTSAAANNLPPKLPLLERDNGLGVAAIKATPETGGRAVSAGDIATDTLDEMPRQEAPNPSDSVTLEGVGIELTDEQEPLLGHSVTSARPSNELNIRDDLEPEPELEAEPPAPPGPSRNTSWWERAREREAGGGLRLLAAMDGDEDIWEESHDDAALETPLTRALSARLPDDLDGSSTERGGYHSSTSDGHRYEVGADADVEGDASADDYLESSRLYCCGLEPDPVLVTVFLAQALHV
eukprot:COSAG02_NODE_13997_length_1322_cov_436.354865_1_plen_313_part_10